MLFQISEKKHAKNYMVPPYHSERRTLAQCCFNVGPPSTTLALHENNIGSMSRYCWDMFITRLALTIIFTKNPPIRCSASTSLTFSHSLPHSFISLHSGPRLRRQAPLLYTIIRTGKMSFPQFTGVVIGTHAQLVIRMRAHQACQVRGG